MFSLDLNSRLKKFEFWTKFQLEKISSQLDQAKPLILCLIFVYIATIEIQRIIINNVQIFKKLLINIFILNLEQ